MVLILSGAGGGCGHAPSPRQDPHPSPAELPALPSRPRPGARPLPAPCARQPCCSCPRCWRSWLTVRDPGVRRQDWGRGRVPGVGREDHPRAKLRASGCPAQAPRSAGCAAPRAGRAGRGTGSAGGKLPLLPPFAPGRDLAFNHLSGSNGIFQLQFITPPTPRIHSRVHPLATSPHSRRLGALGSMPGGRAQGGESGRSRWRPRVPPRLSRVKLRSTLPPVPGPLTAEGRGRMAAGPGFGTSLTSLRLGAATRESGFRVQFQGETRWVRVPLSGSSLCPGLQQLRSWDRDSVLPGVLSLHPPFLHTPGALATSLPAVLLGPSPPHGRRLFAGGLLPHPAVLGPPLAVRSPTSSVLG